MTGRGMVLLVLVSGSIFADPYTFVFDPNDLIDLYTTGNSEEYAPQQENARLVYGGSFSRVAATYTDHPSRGSRWTGNDAYYADWLAGLGQGEGIHAFNIWITTAGYLGSYGNPYSRIDSQQSLFCGVNDPSIWIGGAASGDWQAELVMVYDDATWGPSYGIQWSTTNPDAYLRPGGADLGPFSFTLRDVWTGSDPENPQEIADGQQYRMFFGSTSLVFDDQGWGTSSGLPAFTNYPSSQWQGDMMVTGYVVPEPSSVLLIGLAGSALLIRQRLHSRYG